jgi:hypothetical protein
MKLARKCFHGYNYVNPRMYLINKVTLSFRLVRSNATCSGYVCLHLAPQKWLLWKGLIQ